MTNSVERQSVDVLQQTLQNQLPELGGELEVAIKALRKVQRITGILPLDSSPAMTGLDLRTLANSETLDISPSTDAGKGNGSAQAQPSSSPKSQMMSSGQTFGRYQISRQLGQGAMGAVYLAYDPQLQRYVALKTPFLADKPIVAQRFYREARSAAQIRSPFVCPIYEVSNVAGSLYLTMAFIEGRPLSKWIHKDQPHTLDEVLSMFHKIATGMQKAHAHEVIHRDLKPENIMVDSDGEPIIMDFGLARRADDDDQLTIAGNITGTPAYMSPEQVRGQQDEIGPQSDVYSLGVVLYEMLTGTVPFRGSVVTVLARLLNEQPAPPSSVQPNLPPDSPIEKICLKMMAKNKSDRYTSMTEVLADIVPLLRQAPIPVAPPKPSFFGSIGKFFKRPSASPASSPPRTVK